MTQQTTQTTTPTPIPTSSAALGFDGVSNDDRLIWMAARRALKMLAPVISNVAQRRRSGSLAMLGYLFDVAAAAIERRLFPMGHD